MQSEAKFLLYLFNVITYVKNLKLSEHVSFEINQPQIYKDSNTYVEWMRGTFVCDNLLLAPPWGGAIKFGPIQIC